MLQVRYASLDKIALSMISVGIERRRLESTCFLDPKHNPVKIKIKILLYTHVISPLANPETSMRGPRNIKYKPTIFYRLTRLGPLL